MLTDDQLKQFEDAAIDLVRGAGKILLTYFDGPLQVDYKSPNNRNPVTEADHAADAFIRAELAKRFPGHAVLTEESEEGVNKRADIVWVVDPLDGTTNFLNRLPMFAVMVAALERGEPVAAAIFVPSIGSEEGRVLHARRGGGAFDEDVRLSLERDEPPARRMAAMPGYFLRMFSFRRHLRRRLGDVRVTGSAGFEHALAARGVFDYTAMNGPWIWDMAAGLLLVLEAGGTALTYNRRTRTWSPFHRFDVESEGDAPTPAELRRWRAGVMMGTGEATSFISTGMGIKRFAWRRLRQQMAGWIGRSRRP